ncbi:MAG: DUF89 family protein [Erysipelotrichales bacterium]|nr:DUF89 family protein [Erysipelotrichales bacterium]
MMKKRKKKSMKTTPSCAACLYRRQKAVHDDPVYLARIQKILDERKPSDSSPYLSELFRLVREEMYGPDADFRAEKKMFNELVLEKEDTLWERILSSEDPLKTAILYSRVGNYIDFGTVQVDKDTFLGMFDTAVMSAHDQKTYESFKKEMAKAKEFVLMADNCGEIVLDKLLIRYLKKEYPGLHASVIVRGGEILNDVTAEDAAQVRLYDEADVIPNGIRVSGTMYDLVSDAAKKAIDKADVIVSKGLGNYEAFAGCGKHAFYLFLCKCDLFTERFGVPMMTGMFTEEW